MSDRSQSIIRHLVDENLIDAKAETENYLNDILSDSLRSKYQQVAPPVFDTTGEEEGA